MPTTKHSKTKEDVKQIVHSMATILLPTLGAIEQLISNFTSKLDLNAAKANIVHDRFALDKIDKYQRRESIRLGNFSPDGDLCNEIVKMLNHMMGIEPPDDTEEGTRRQSLLKSKPAQKKPVFTKSNISVCHFTKPRQGQKRQAIVRFVSRQSIRTIYQYKVRVQYSEVPEFRTVFSSMTSHL